MLLWQIANREAGEWSIPDRPISDTTQGRHGTRPHRGVGPESVLKPAAEHAIEQSQIRRAIGNIVGEDLKRPCNA
jgi:hypothetical protein